MLFYDGLKQQAMKVYYFKISYITLRIGLRVTYSLIEKCFSECLHNSSNRYNRLASLQ